MGRVLLVGAGPGDPGLLTLRGKACLEAADLVLYDYLANAELLDFAPPHATRICLGRHGQGRIWTQDEIHVRMIAEARAGRTVVRLKGGDPAVFARLAEETDALDRAGVPYEIVPGITVASAVAAYAGILLTERHTASAVALVAGQESDAKTGPSLPTAALAAFPGTLVYYMGVTRAARWCGELLAAGKAPTTPTAIVRRCSWPDQQVRRTTLAEVPALLDQARDPAERIRPPVLIVVGETVGRMRERTWFSGRPLHGTCVLVTRAAGQSTALRQELQALGAEVLVQPAVEILPPEDWAAADASLAAGDAHPFDLVLFASANAVDGFFDRLFATGRDLRWLARAQLAAIGPGTADALLKRGLRADFVPLVHKAEEFADELAPHVAGRRCLLPRGNRGRDVLPERLTAAGALMETITVYRSEDILAPDPAVAERLRAGRIDWTTATSPAIAKALATMFGEDLRRTRVVSVSPLTSAALREAGCPPAAEATDFTMHGIIEAILRETAR